MRQAVKHANLRELCFAIITVRQKQNIWPVYKIVWHLSIQFFFLQSPQYILQQSFLKMLELIFLY